MIINCFYDEDMEYADIIYLPNIGLRVDDLQEAFFKWLFNKNNNHKYWIIVNGEKKACKYGAGKPDKTEFPQSWSDDKILHYVSDVATDPNATWGVGKWNSPYAIGVREGIEIRVDFYPDAYKNYRGMISTAYPLNTPPNPPKGGGY